MGDFHFIELLLIFFNVLFLNIYLMKKSYHISINILSGLQKGLLTFLKAVKEREGLVCRN